MAKKKEVAPEVLYPHVSVEVYGTPEQTGVSEEMAAKVREALSILGLKNAPITFRGPLTSEDMIRILGCEWETDDGPKFGNEYLFTDWHGKKVRAHKNIRNRPVTISNYLAIEQDYLRGKWELNGESMIVGRTGINISIQHRGIALIRAQQRLECEKDMDSKESRWSALWPNGKVSIPAIIVYGIEESDRVINTVDTAKPRTLADVLYRSPYFANLAPRSSDGLNRETAARICDHAIKQIWLRTGIYNDPFSPIRTHSESIAWLEGHGGMSGHFLKCVRHVMEENRFKSAKTGDDGEVIEKWESGKIAQYVPLGYAVAMMWLMGCSVTPSDSVEDYYAQDERKEKILTFDKAVWSRAIEFWSEFGKKGTEHFKILHKSLDAITAEEAEGSGRFREKDYVICKAWRLFRDEEEITTKGIRIEKGEPDPGTGRIELLNYAPIGGIDLGNVRIKKNPLDGLEPPEEMRAEVENGIEKLQNGHTVPTKTEEEQPSSTEQILGKLHTENPDLGPIFLKSALGRWVVWDVGATIVGPIIGREPKLHPSKLLHISVKQEDIEDVCDKLTDAQITVGMAEEKDGKWSVNQVFRPSKKPRKQGVR